MKGETGSLRALRTERSSSPAKSCLRIYERRTVSVANLAGIRTDGSRTVAGKTPRMRTRACVSSLVFLVRSAVELFTVTVTMFVFQRRETSCLRGRSLRDDAESRSQSLLVICAHLLLLADQERLLVFVREPTPPISSHLCETGRFTSIEYSSVILKRAVPSLRLASAQLHPRASK